MSHPSKQKGYRLEKKFIDQVTQKWGASAQRAYGSQGGALGEKAGVDALLGNGRTRARLKVQLKKRKKLGAIVRPDPDADIQVVSEDGGGMFVVIPLDMFMLLTKEWWIDDTQPTQTDPR